MKTKITFLLLLGFLVRLEFYSQNNLNATISTFKQLTPLILPDGIYFLQSENLTKRFTVKH